MKRLALVTLLAGLAVPAQASSGSSLLTVRPNGQFGPLAVVSQQTQRARARIRRRRAGGVGANAGDQTGLLLA